MLLGTCCENCWDFFPKLLQQAYGVLLVACGEMSIAQGHTDVLVSEQFFHRRQINPDITRRLAKVYRKSWKVKSSNPAFCTAFLNAERNDL